jgi:hypothetical protein
MIRPFRPAPDEWQCAFFEAYTIELAAFKTAPDLAGAERVLAAFGDFLALSQPPRATLEMTKMLRDRLAFALGQTL